ncbi:hypothetical protein [Pseudomonas sp. zfem003]|uniref:hypothetical protein n=1 Tax=Pseudomonas sp. zfem003 TaxID=3078198 RepID=UPI00292766F6|nr:hypothetical protein [Pseudomonas sp. zfem003]MDU9398087.1 hypothetical protein [Pseudomonas sp. zfem003]
MSQYIVLSLKHTKRRDKAITLWRPDDRGYCWTLNSAGSYSEEQVLERLGYYNSGCSNVAVPFELVRSLVREVEYDTGEFGICLPNNAATWKELLANLIRTPQYQPEPEYRGARYPRKAVA